MIWDTPGDPLLYGIIPGLFLPDGPLLGVGVSSTDLNQYVSRSRSKSQVQTLNSTCCTVSRAFCPITSRIHLFRVRTHRLSSKFEIELILGYAAARSVSSTKSVDFRMFTICAYARLGNSHTLRDRFWGFGSFWVFSTPIWGFWGLGFRIFLFKNSKDGPKTRNDVFFQIA